MDTSCVYYTKHFEISLALRWDATITIILVKFHSYGRRIFIQCLLVINIWQHNNRVSLQWQQNFKKLFNATFDY